VRKSLEQYHDIGDFLPVLADRIAKVGDAAEQAAILKKMGGEELLPLLKDGAAGFDALAKKAQDLGIVMDHATIEKAEEAKKKLTELDDVMKAKANITFAEFADTLIKVKQAFLDAETAGLRFLAMITGTESIQGQAQGPGAGRAGPAEGAGLRQQPGRQAAVRPLPRRDPAAAGRAGQAMKPEEVPSAKDKVKQLIPTAKKKAHPRPTRRWLRQGRADAYNNGLKALIKAQGRAGGRRGPGRRPRRLGAVAADLDQEAQGSRGLFKAGLGLPRPGRRRPGERPGHVDL
jgi:hypothetical protein